MDCKDCHNTDRPIDRKTERRTGCGAVWLASLFVAMGGTVSQVQAGNVRLWPNAVVTGDTVSLGDVGEIRGFPLETEATLRALIVATSPKPGGSRIVHIDMIRETLLDGGINMATLTLQGATRCAISRPVVTAQIPREADAARSGRSEQTGASPARGTTLREAIFEYFNNELRRYHGRAEIVFDGTSAQILALSGPTYRFTVRRRHGVPLGLLPIDVGVHAGDKVVQTVSMVVRVTMLRPAVIARRSINQGATIRASDLDFLPMSFTRVDRLGLDEMALAVGQRAKRFIPSGASLESTMLEAVPLVHRGQLVTLQSVVNGIRVVTTAKAVESGLLGEYIRVRAVDDSRVEYDAAVVGPGSVQIGGTPLWKSAMFAPRGGNDEA